MKNLKLLLATTAILSMGAMAANAQEAPASTSNQATLEMRAAIIRPMQLIPETYLGFGAILGDEGGKLVVVSPTGDTTGTTATMLSTSSFKNYARDENGNELNVTTGSLNPAKIRIKNALDDTALRFVGEQGEEAINSAMVATFADSTVELTDLDTDAPCGEVSQFSQHFTIDGDDVILNIGGTFETESATNSQNSLICSGYTTVTVLYSSGYGNIQDAWVNAIEAAAATPAEP